MGDHDASEVALRVGFMMKVLSEERDGARVIKSHGDLSARLMHMATNTGNKYKQKVGIVYELYMTRRVLQGPVDVYVKALKSICQGDVEGGQGGQGGQQEEAQQKNGDGQHGQQEEEEDLGDPGEGDVQGGQEEEEEVLGDLGDVQGDVQGGQEEDPGDLGDVQGGQEEEVLGQGGQDGQEEEVLGDIGNQGGQQGGQQEGADGGWAETWKSLSLNKAPLAQNTMPRAGFDIQNPSSMVQRFSPWTEEVWESDNLVNFSMTSAVLQGIPTRRRTCIQRNYNAGKMFAVLRNGKKAMAPSQQIQSYVDDFTRARGSKIVLEKYMVFLKKAVTIKDKKTKEAVWKKRTPYGTGKYVKVGGNGKRKLANVFDIDDASDTDTELEYS